MIARYKAEDNWNWHWLLNGWVDVCVCSKIMVLLTFTKHSEGIVHEYWGTPSTVSRMRTCLPSCSGILMSMLSSFLNVLLFGLLLNMYDIDWFNLLWLIWFIVFDIHTLQIGAIIDEQIGQLGRGFIIHDLVNHAYIVVREEIDRTILGHYTSIVRRQ